MPGARQRSQPQCKACQYHGSRKPGLKDRKVSLVKNHVKCSRNAPRGAIHLWKLYKCRKGLNCIDEDVRIRRNMRKLEVECEKEETFSGATFWSRKTTGNIHYKGNNDVLDEATSLAVFAQPVKGNIPAPLCGTGFAPSVHRPEPVAGMMAQHVSSFCSWIRQEGWTIDPSGPFEFLVRSINSEFGK